MVGFVSSRTQVQKNNTSKLRYLYPWDAGGVGKVWTKHCTKYKKQHRQSCSSERHENIHTPIPLHTNTHKAFHIQYLQLPCPPKTTSTTHRHTNLSWHFSFSHGHTLCCCPTDANLILGYPSHQAVTLCSLLTFLLLRWWCIWTGQSCVCGKWFWGPAWFRVMRGHGHPASCLSCWEILLVVALFSQKKQSYSRGYQPKKKKGLCYKNNILLSVRGNKLYCPIVRNNILYLRGLYGCLSIPISQSD